MAFGIVRVTVLLALLFTCVTSCTADAMDASEVIEKFCADEFHGSPDARYRYVSIPAEALAEFADAAVVDLDAVPLRVVRGFEIIEVRRVGDVSWATVQFDQVGRFEGFGVGVRTPVHDVALERVEYRLELTNGTWKISAPPEPRVGGLALLAFLDERIASMEALSSTSRISSAQKDYLDSLRTEHIAVASWLESAVED